MIIDKFLQFDDGEAHTGAGKSTNIIDFGSLRDVGTGTTLYLMVVCTEAMAGASDVTVKVETDDASGFPSGSIVQEVGSFPAGSPAGSSIIAKIDPKKIDEQFAQLDYSISGAANTAGSFSAFITNSVDSTQDYPIAYEIA